MQIQSGTRQFRIIRVTEVTITVDDPDALAQHLRNTHDAILTSADIAENLDPVEGMAICAERGERLNGPGFRYRVEGYPTEVQPIRTCRFCGCTEEEACVLDDEGTTCTWSSKHPNTCTNPECLLKAKKEARP